MGEKSIHFWYLKGNHVENYRKNVLDYLEKNSESFERFGIRHNILVGFNGIARRKGEDIKGYLLLHDWGISDSGKLEEICDYILSSDRGFIPVLVSCEDKNDYSMIENILEENYGDSGKLTNGFLGLGKLFNLRTIKGRTIREMSFGNYVQLLPNPKL